MDSAWLDFGTAAINVPGADDRVVATDAVLARNPASLENLAAHVWQTAAARRSHPAVVWRGQPISYDAIRLAAARVREFLLCRPDFGPGSRVAVVLENSPEYLAAFYGVLLADGVVVPVPARVERERWRHICQSRAPVVVLSRKEDAPPEIFQATDRTFVLRFDRDSEPAVSDGLERMGAAVARGGRDLAMLMFTSGSTGVPKGVMLSHRNLLSNARSILGFLPIREDDRALVVVPFYHAFGNSVLQTHLLAGATLVLDGSLVIPSTLVQALGVRRATSFSGVPEIFAMLLRYAPWQRGDLPDLRYMAVAGGALRSELAEQVSEIIAPADLYVMYGQSEATARLSYLPPQARPSRRGSIGKGIPGVELRVVSPGGTGIRVGEIGMLQARGDNIMLGYWQDPQATATVLQDGWLSCGDLATVDEDGFIYLQGRANHLVKLHGNRVHPAEIEDVVARHFPGAQVVVLPYEADELMRLALFFAPPRGAACSERDVLQCCSRELPHYKVPHRIEVLERLPLNGALKVDREELARRVRSPSQVEGSERYAHDANPK